jgi:hypothetical protein
MTIESFVEVMRNATPTDWNFLYAVEEMMLSYEGSYPLVFAVCSPEDLQFIGGGGPLLTTYTQKVYFMINEAQDSLGLNRSDSTTPDTLIQLPSISIAQQARDAFLFAVRDADLLSLSNITSKPIPRFIENGGKVLVGYELNFRAFGELKPC